MNNTKKSKSLSQRLSDTAAEIIIEAVKFGLDEAGTRLLGPTAWKGFKRIASPVIKKLQNRFPALKFGNKEDQAAEAAAKDAAVYLRADTELRSLLFENFDKLSEGQEKVLTSIDRLESTVEATAQVVKKTSEDVGTITKTAAEILNEIQEMRSDTSSTVLPATIDMSDFIDAAFLFARVKARREGSELNIPIFTTILMIATIEQFKQRVLEDGQSAKTYKTSFGPHIVTMTARGKYEDSNGRLCRKYSIIQPDFVNDLSQRVSISGSYFRDEGFWRPV